MKDLNCPDCGHDTEILETEFIRHWDYRMFVPCSCGRDGLAAWEHHREVAHLRNRSRIDAEGVAHELRTEVIADIEDGIVEADVECFVCATSEAEGALDPVELVHERVSGPVIRCEKCRSLIVNLSKTAVEPDELTSDVAEAPSHGC